MQPFPYDAMREPQDALERLDLTVRWGNYEIRVLRFHLTSFAPGKTIGFHNHSEFEFHFIPRGKGKVTLVDMPFELTGGDFYLTGPGIMHYQEADAHEAMDELCLHIDIVDRSSHTLLNTNEFAGDPWEIAEAKNCVEQLQNVPLTPVHDLYKAMPLFLEAYKACSENFVGSYTTIKQCIVQILLRAARAYGLEHTRPELPSRDLNVNRCRFVLQYIRANYAGTLTLEDIAEKLHISSRQLQRILKTHHDDRTFVGIVEDIRLEAVCRKLEESELSIEKIAVSEGFSNGNYLHAIFRKRFGMTPLNYRTQKKRKGGRKEAQNE
jgi:AraC family 4-hydroxyphenylacetate 3-monooxygenase operon regulatory protein